MKDSSVSKMALLSTILGLTAFCCFAGYELRYRSGASTAHFVWGVLILVSLANSLTALVCGIATLIQMRLFSQWRRPVSLALIGLFFCLATFGLIAESWHNGKKVAQRCGCIGNLRHIQNAKEQIAMAFKLKNGDPTPTNWITYVGGTIPTCPSGGRYTINPIGSPPACSITEHNRNWLLCIGNGQ